MSSIFEDHLNLLAEKLDAPGLYTKEKESNYALTFGDFSIKLTTLEKGCILYSPVYQKPKKGLESFYMHVMQANYLGQGTSRCLLGLDPSEEQITLSCWIETDLSFPQFKEKLEIFLNYLDYWQRSIADQIEKDANELV